METGKYCVYKHTAPNGKVYIGMTLDPVRRWKNGNGYKGQKKFYDAIKYFGWDNFKHEILYSNISEYEARERETELIKAYKSTDAKFGYNTLKGGQYIGIEARRKLSLKLKNNRNAGDQRGVNNNFYGHHHTKEARQKISEAQYNPVLQYDKFGNFIAEYSNSYQAHVQTRISHVLECCKHQRKSAGGYIWRFKNEL